MFTRSSAFWLAALALAAAGCTKPPPPMVVSLKAPSGNGSEVLHTFIKVHPEARKLVLNMEVLSSKEFSSYRATLNRGMDKLSSFDGLKIAPDGNVRMDLDADVVTAGEYTVALQGIEESGKATPLGTYEFQAIK